jgi:hypothetical protein
MTTQDRTPEKILVSAAVIIIAGLLAFVMLAFFSGCTSKVHKTKTEVSSTLNEIAEKQDSIRLLKSEIAQLQSELRQKQYAGVVFDSTRCPKMHPVIINGCNNDSINSLVHYLNSRIEAYNNLLNEKENKIEILNDGTIRAAGKIKSANYSNEVSKRIIATWQAKYDSLAEEKLKSESNIKIEYKDKVVERTVTVFPWWFLLIAGAFAFLWLNEKYRLFTFKK